MTKLDDIKAAIEKATAPWEWEPRGEQAAVFGAHKLAVLRHGEMGEACGYIVYEANARLACLLRNSAAPMLAAIEAAKALNEAIPFLAVAFRDMKWKDGTIEKMALLTREDWAKLTHASESFRRALAELEGK